MAIYLPAYTESLNWLKGPIVWSQPKKLYAEGASNAPIIASDNGIYAAYSTSPATLDLFEVYLPGCQGGSVYIKFKVRSGYVSSTEPGSILFYVQGYHELTIGNITDAKNYTVIETIISNLPLNPAIRCKLSLTASTPVMSYQSFTNIEVRAYNITTAKLIILQPSYSDTVSTGTTKSQDATLISSAPPPKPRRIVRPAGGATVFTNY